MTTTVQNVHEWHRENVGLLGSGQIGGVGVQRNTLLGSTSLGNTQTDTQNGIGTQLSLVGSSIELFKEVIDLGLVFNIDVLLDEGRSDDFIDVLDGSQNTFTKRQP